MENFDPKMVRFSNTAPRFQWSVWQISFINRLFKRFRLAHGRTLGRAHARPRVRKCDTCMFQYESPYGDWFCHWAHVDCDKVKQGDCWYEGGNPNVANIVKPRR